MSTVRVVRGTGRAPTALSAYDAALAGANVHDYNLVGVSSVLPPDADVEVLDAAPDLGPVGGRLLVVEATASVAGDGPVSAALGWTRAPDGAGVVYEAAGATGPDTVTSEVRTGLAAARELRGWAADVEETVVATVPPGGAVDASAGGGAGDPGTGGNDDAPDRYTAAVALAAYGAAEPVA